MNLGGQVISKNHEQVTEWKQSCRHDLKLFHKSSGLFPWVKLFLFLPGCLIPQPLLLYESCLTLPYAQPFSSLPSLGTGNVHFQMQTGQTVEVQRVLGKEMTPTSLNSVLGMHLEHWQSVCCPGQSFPSISLLDCPGERTGMNLRLRQWAGENAAKTCFSLPLSLCFDACSSLASKPRNPKMAELAIYWLVWKKIVIKD